MNLMLTSQTSVLLPLITAIVNASLLTGTVPISSSIRRSIYRCGLDTNTVERAGKTKFSSHYTLFDLPVDDTQERFFENRRILMITDFVVAVSLDQLLMTQWLEKSSFSF